MAKIPIYLWIPHNEDYVELYNDRESVLSEPIYDKADLKESIEFYEKEGYDLSEVKKELEDPRTNSLLKATWEAKEQG